MSVECRNTYPNVFHEAGLERFEAVEPRPGDVFVEFWGGRVGYAVAEGRLSREAVATIKWMTDRTHHAYRVERGVPRS